LIENFQVKTFNLLLQSGIENFVGVPDSTLKHFISEGLKIKKIIISTREEEAIGIAVGMSLSKSKSLVFMQNAGFANSLSTITSLVQMYKIPLIFLIGWRGYLSNDAPEHKKIGKIQPDLMKLMGIPSKIITEKNWKKVCTWAIKKNNSNSTCALIVRRDFLD
jgi:sulfopyruvate decarboxylase TPP-binding subunit